MNFVDLVVRAFYLLSTPGAYAPDQQSDNKERTGRQKHEAVGFVPAAVRRQLENREAEQCACAEQLAQRCYGNKNQAVAEAIAETINEAHDDAILHGKRFGATKNDTVRDDQADEYR